MMHRVVSLAAALAVVLFVGAAVAAEKAEKDNAKGATVTGTISKVSADTITVTDKNGKDHALTVAKDAKIECDGQTCKLADLDPTKVTSVTVTLNADHKDQAEEIVAKTK